MIVRCMKAMAIAVCIAGATLTYASSSASAATRATGRIDECKATCSGGSCSAETSWYEFFSDCTCNCGTDGRPKCGCD